eukprot:snap_masked-scaffold_8-processed-gene-11.9-mRNA-1 protein AED:0.70 eAED:1.00 QI:0/-1/0/1/-1/1/1/0/287
MKFVHTQSNFDKKVLFFRCFSLILLFLAIEYSNELDSLVSGVWKWFFHSWWFRHDSFEPIFATISFTLWIDIFMVIDYWCPKPFEKYLISPRGRSAKRTYKDNLNRAAGAAYLIPLLTIDYFFPRREQILRNYEDFSPTFFSTIFNLILSLFAYDLLFFPLHLIMHKGPKILRKLHKKHHTYSPLVSAEVIRHSLVDGSLQVITNILALNILGLNPFSRMIHNFAVTGLLTETHSGYNFPWAIHNIIPFEILGGPLRHERHHKNGRAYYQQFFTYLDNLFSFVEDRS